MRDSTRPLPALSYTVEDWLAADAFIACLERSGLAERRPVHDRDRIERMLRNASLIVCARTLEGTLIGVARAITDFAFCCYLSDLAVDRAYQGRGVGRELIRRTRGAAGGDAVSFLLLAAPAALSYYEHIGLPKVETCFGILARRSDPANF